MSVTFTISRRVSGGFAVLLLITLLLGALSAWWMHTAAASARYLSRAIAPEADVAAHLAQASAQAQLATRTYGLTGDPAQLELARKQLAEVERALDACRKLAQTEPSLQTLAAGIAQADTALAAYRAGFDATRANLDELTRLRTELDQLAHNFLQTIEAYIAHEDASLSQEIAAAAPAEKLERRHRKILLGNEITDAGNAISLANYRAQAFRDPQLMAQALPLFDVVANHVATLRQTTTQQINQEQLTTVSDAAKKYRAGVESVVRNSADAKRLQEIRTQAANQLDTTIRSVLDGSIQHTTAETDRASTTLTRTSTLVLLGLLSALIVGPVAAWLIVRSLNRALRDTSLGLTQGAIQIAAASSQVSSTSQGLAEGASEQAASLEEISSSLEELSSTTKHNAENATAAKAAADTARTTAEHGAQEMEKMQQAMAGIRQSSSDISKIIKTIDEIAFQTNILALNAAVEAARAGEAGAGFAVVADEVRNLAQRCAVAAKETTEKISDAASRSEAGASLSVSVTTSLQAIVTQSREVDRLVAEVASASREQSAGLEQVNTAVGQMDQVTQANAASAEEAAAAAEELNAQSLELRHAADSLAALVGLATDSAPATAQRPIIESVKVTARAANPATAPVAPAEATDLHFR